MQLFRDGNMYVINNYCPSCTMQHAPMEISGWLVALMTLKVVSRSAIMECGEQCVMICGVPMMPALLADNWDTLQQVIINAPKLKCKCEK